MSDLFDPDAESNCDGVFGLPHDPDIARFVLLPVPFDATTSYRQGTADGPQAILEASWQVDLRDVETGDPWEAGIAMLPLAETIHDLNREARRLIALMHEPEQERRPQHVARVNAIGAEVTAWVRHEVGAWIDRGKIVGVVGGDHASPLGAILACAERFPGLGVLHIDAHADLRVAYQGFVHSHASIMHNALQQAPSIATLVQIGVRDVCSAEMRVIESSPDRIHTWYDATVAESLFRGSTFASLVERMLEPLPHEVYVSFDIDGLDPSLCPNTGTPVPGGLSFQQASYLLGALAKSGRRIVGFDLCEVAGPGAGHDIDAIVGARVLYKLIGWALVSERSGDR